LVIEVTERFGGRMASVVKSLRRARCKPQARARRCRRRQLRPRDALERAIGVIHQPLSRTSEPLVRRQRARQFDALVHIDHARAVEPLERTQAWTLGELPETYTTAL
jgi:erythromycin esterase-like protein